MTTTTATFAALLATLYAAHTLADHVLGQTDTQAQAKANPGTAGWYALGRHLAGYHLVVVAMVTTTWAVLDLPLSATGAAAGLAVSVVTHALWDRRWPVAWVLTRTGGRAFADLALVNEYSDVRWRPGMYTADLLCTTGLPYPSAAALAVVGRELGDRHDKDYAELFGSEPEWVGPAGTEVAKYANYAAAAKVDHRRSREPTLWVRPGQSSQVFLGWGLHQIVPGDTERNSIRAAGARPAYEPDLVSRVGEVTANSRKPRPGGAARQNREVSVLVLIDDLSLHASSRDHQVDFGGVCNEVPRCDPPSGSDLEGGTGARVAVVGAGNDSEGGVCRGLDPQWNSQLTPKNLVAAKNSDYGRGNRHRGGQTGDRRASRNDTCQHKNNRRRVRPGFASQLPELFPRQQPAPRSRLVGQFQLDCHHLAAITRPAGVVPVPSHVGTSR